MGCSAAKNLTVEQLNGDTGNENGTETRKVSITRRASEVPPLQSDEPPEEVLDSGTLNNLQEHCKLQKTQYLFNINSIIPN